MKKMTAVLLMMICCTLFSACNSEEDITETTAPNAQLTTSETATEAATQLITNPTTRVQESTAYQEAEPQTQSMEQTGVLQMTIGDTPVSVDWEDNETVQALKELCSNQPLTIQMSMYGGFEQVGSIGTDLPRNDVQITTSSGDIVLYSGNQMVVFYGSNSWAYTRLGHITNQSADGMTNLLSNGDTVITISLE